MSEGGKDPLAEAADALDDGRPEDALTHLVSCAPEDPDRALLETLARLELGDLERARTALQVAAQRLDRDDPDLLWASGELALREWRVADALASFHALAVFERAPATLERLALCHDLADDFAEADRLLAEAFEADPDTPPPPRLSEAEFDTVVDQAVRDLPGAFQEVLANTRIVIEPMPFKGLVLSNDPAQTPPDLLGLFWGASRLESSEEGPEVPPSIYLFQRNLERFARDHEQLRQEIRITLYHEIGHFFGLDEDEVDAMGLG